MLLLNTLFILFIEQIFGAIRTDPDHKWKNVKDGIKIYNQSSYKGLDYAMKKIEQYTCLKWNKSSVEIKDEQGINIKLIQESFCYSSETGATSSDKPNTIYATSDCLNNDMEMLSLLFNALGLSYEHNRNDRDEYVEIFNSSIDESKLKYVTKDKDLNFTTENYGTVYDFGSILHGRFDFLSQKNSQTILPKGNYSGWLNKTIGQREVRTFNLFKLFNFLYCNDTCINVTPKPNCLRNGYQDPKNCEQCQCPYPFEGPTCNSMRNDSGYCPGTFYEVTEKEEERGFNGHNYCFISFKTKESQYKVKITIVQLNFCGYGINSCSIGNTRFVEVIYRKDRSVMGLCLCACIGGQYEPVSITSEDNEAFIVYHGNTATDGLKFKYQAVN
uniref:ZnMc domain-containing protein n=1 Tax=Parastrongyloides trichosuri TaxID=131310 RepID=A0A0N4ZA85_PARTI